MVAANYNAVTIAKWFVAWACEAEKTGISNLKLQKLLYYAQGHYLAKTGKPLFDEEIQAWSHGPVIPEVYHLFKHFASSVIELDDDDEFAWSDVDPDTTRFLMMIWNTYGGFAAWRLRNMTHEEAPWRDNFVDGERETRIPWGSLEKFFVPRTHAS